MSLTLKSSGLQNQVGPPFLVHMTLNILFLLKDGWNFCLLHQLPVHWFCSVYFEIIDFFIDSHNKSMVFSNFVVDCDTKLKLARM
jgi:hypothetical protein